MSDTTTEVRQRAISQHMETMHGWGGLTPADDPEGKHDALHATNEGEDESLDSDDHLAEHEAFPVSQPSREGEGQRGFRAIQSAMDEYHGR